MRSPMLFSPGPVMVEDCVRHALLHYDICHRSSEFESMFQDTQQKILKLFQADESYYSLIVSGSGTSANETCLSSLCQGKDKVLLLSNGVFGERLEEIIDKYGIPKVKPDFEWAEMINADKAEEALKENPDISVIAMVFHETSTSMINPVREIGKLARKYDKVFFVDCVSAAGGEFIDVVNNNIDICTSVAGKCLGGFPGSAYICAKESLLRRIPAEQGKNVYLNLGKHYEIAKKSRQTPNTPNVTLFWALNKALERILEAEGLENRINRYKECAGIIRSGLKEMGLKFLIPQEQMSNTVTSVFLPSGTDLKEFMKAMEDDGYVIYAGKGKYEAMGMFQVANMGNIFPDDCRKFLEALKRNIEKIKVQGC
jgi:2-aminoethylphosphonate-pyruvate transaminase